MKNLTLRTFTFLDILSLFFLAMQLWVIASSNNQLNQLLSEKVRSILLFPLFFLILIGAYGLFFGKTFGFILYYIQFPFRLYLSVFTFGLITLLPEAMNDFEDKWPVILLKLCVMAEFIRLYLTIREHQKKFQLPLLV
jgi:hypothetical protein